MILLAGLPDEPPIARVATALDDLGIAFRMIDQRRHADLHLSFDPAGAQGVLQGKLRCAGEEDITLEGVTGLYQRLHSDESFPELCKLPQTDPARQRFGRFVTLFTVFSDLCTGRVLNRTPGMGTNNSKPFQAQIIARAGFGIPRTLITNAPDRARAFVQDARAQGREVIFKSASAVRSIVRRVTAEDLDRLDRLRICPVQFQERVEGCDVRVHVVGSEVFATRITTTGVDYRYASRDEGGSTELEPFDLPPEVAKRAVALSQMLDLPLAGIDLRETPSGDWVCFEVNPSPAYSYYEANTGQPISTAIARYLAA
jgi:glutathione synthase/RimK-type ligase-like ATP-grasp enzyme